MKRWILSIGIVVIITSVISLILPEGKVGKYVKGFLSLSILLVIIQPLLTLKSNDLQLNTPAFDDNIIIQNDYLDYVNNEKIRFNKEECYNILKKYQINNGKIDFEIDKKENNLFEIKKVWINLDNSVINQENQHIDIKKNIIKEISVYLNIKPELVVIYG